MLYAKSPGSFCTEAKAKYKYSKYKLLIYIKYKFLIT